MINYFIHKMEWSDTAPDEVRVIDVFEDVDTALDCAEALNGTVKEDSNVHYAVVVARECTGGM